MGRSLRISEEGLEIAKKAFDFTGWTQDYLAGSAKCTRPTVNKFFARGYVEKRIFEAICSELKLTVGEIADFKSEEEQLSKFLSSDGSGIQTLQGNTNESSQDRCDSMGVLTEAVAGTKEQNQTDKERLAFAIAGSVSKIDIQKLKAIVGVLQKLTGDTSIEIIDIEKGSIRIILEASQKSLKQIESLFKSGQLTEVEGIPVEDVQFVDSNIPEHDKDIKSIDKKKLVFTIAGSASSEEIQQLKAVFTEAKPQAKPRLLRVRPQYISRVKSAVWRNGYSHTRDLAEDLKISLTTVSNFLNGRAIDYNNFTEICRVLAQDWQEIVSLEKSSSNDVPTSKNVELELVINDLYHNQEETFIYIERPPIESSCYETVLQPGTLIRIKAPLLTGKTSLMVRLLAQVAKQNYRTVYLNLHLADKTDFANLDQFLKWFCISVGQSLGLPNRTADYWDEQFSTSKMNCTEYFEQYLLAQASSPLVLCLDEVDQIFPYGEVAVNFFELLRAWHEQGKCRNIWKRLRLIIAHPTEISIAMNINKSPFNIGLPIELPDFTPEQVQELAHRYGLNWIDAQVQQLMDMVGGHPYLVQQAISQLKVRSNLSLDQLLETSATEAGIYGDYLRRYWYLIQQHPELLKALEKVIMATSSVSLEAMQAYKLDSMGLVHLQGNEVALRYKLYRQYFGKRIAAQKENAESNPSELLTYDRLSPENP
jgi:serine/threonine-protein kinase